MSQNNNNELLDIDNILYLDESVIVKNMMDYLLPEYLNSVITNKVSNMRKQLTPSRVVFGFEGDATNKQVGK